MATEVVSEEVKTKAAEVVKKMEGLPTKEKIDLLRKEAQPVVLQVANLLPKLCEEVAEYVEHHPELYKNAKV